MNLPPALVCAELYRGQEASNKIILHNDGLINTQSCMSILFWL